MVESDVVEEQFDDSLPDDGNQPTPSNVGNNVAALEAEIRDLKSRLGRQAQVSGEEKKSMERAFAEWQQNWQAYYTEELAKRDKIISDLENELIDKLEGDGARTVIESRDARERAEREATAARAAQQQAYVTALNQAKAEAVAIYTNVKEEDLAMASTVPAVWAAAAKLDRERSQPAPVSTPRPVERVVPESTEEDHVPAPSSQAPRRTAAPVNSVESQIAELESQRRDFIKRGRLAEAVGLMRQISQLRAQ